MGSRLLFWLDELGKEDIQLVGQKCALLAEMLRIGLPVPPGFVLTLYAFDSFMKEYGIGEEISDYLRQSGAALNELHQAEEASKHIYEIIQEREIPQEIRHQVEASYKKLSEQYGTTEIPVSVRSSGVVSHPGMFNTYLNVKGFSELILHIKRCWASVFTPRAIATRAQKGLLVQIEPIAVGVQKMVQARSAGVLFTADPISGDPSLVIIEATWGLGEGIAQAMVTPDKFIVDKETLNIKEKHISHKTCQVVAFEQGTGVVVVPQEKQAIPCLSDEELTRLVKLAKLVEQHYAGVPQDIEWAVDTNFPFPRNIFLLQARPVVGLRPDVAKFSKPAKKGDAEHIVDLLIERYYH